MEFAKRSHLAAAVRASQRGDALRSLPAVCGESAFLLSAAALERRRDAGGSSPRRFLAMIAINVHLELVGCCLSPAVLPRNNSCCFAHYVQCCRNIFSVIAKRLNENFSSKPLARSVERRRDSVRRGLFRRLNRPSQHGRASCFPSLTYDGGQ